MLWRTLVLAALITPLSAQDPIRLDDLPKFCRARSARQRPAQEKKLKPYLVELALEYKLNSRVLDDTVLKVAELGDSIVPILLDYLTPASREAKDRHLAGNSARVLAHLEPSSFLGTLLDLLHSKSKTARSSAIYLLGCSRSSRAATALAAEFGNMTPDEQSRALTALIELDSPAAAGQAVSLLRTSTNTRTRRRVMSYLASTAATAVKTQVLTSFKQEEDDGLLAYYIEYFSATSSADAEVTDAVLPLLGGVRLDRGDYQRLIEALGTIAPKGHKGALRALRDILENGETSSQGITTTRSLTALGDKKAQKLLLDNLNAKINKRRRGAEGYAQRADFHMAFEHWKKAVTDYETAIKLTKVGSQRLLYHLLIARCEAGRGQATKMVRALKASAIGLGTIHRTATEDPRFAAMLKKDVVKKYLKTLK